MSTCVSNVGEFSEHVMLKSPTNNLVCSRCGYWQANDEVEPSVYYDGVEVDAPANIKQGDWNELCLQVSEIHMFIEELKTAMIPMIEQMKSGGLMGMLMGRKGK